MGYHHPGGMSDNQHTLRRVANVLEAFHCTESGMGGLDLFAGLGMLFRRTI